MQNPKQHRIEVEGRTFLVQKFSVLQGLAKFPRVKSIFSASQGETDLSEKELVTFAQDFAKRTIWIKEDGAQVPLSHKDSEGNYTYSALDTCFADDYVGLILWLAACVDLNFDRFLGRLGLVGGIQAPIADLLQSSAQPPSEESSGQSGESQAPPASPTP